MNYTADMEKAMQQSHKIGYAEYSRTHEQRMIVEQKRDAEHEYCKLLMAKIDGKIHK